MQRTLAEHIAALERKIAVLKAEQYDTDHTALERHQSAIDLESGPRFLYPR